LKSACTPPLQALIAGCLVSSCVLRSRDFYFFELRRICAVPAWNNPLALRLFGKGAIVTVFRAAVFISQSVRVIC
jgi:hypothetical protein